MTVSNTKAQTKQFLRSVYIFPWNGCSYQCEGESGLCQQVLGKGSDQLEQVGHVDTCVDVGPAVCTS